MPSAWIVTATPIVTAGGGMDAAALSKAMEADIMSEINLDAADWSTPLDFYAALLPAVGAPAWHSASIAAITDSMIGGEINAVEPPYIVRIHNLAGRPASVVEEVEYAEGAIVRVKTASTCC